MPATKTDLTINGKNALGKSTSNKISYVNPEISNTQAILLAQKFNALTTNIYEATTRTDKTDIDAINPRTMTQLKFYWQEDGSTPAAADVPADGIINLTTAQIVQKQIPIFFKTPFDGTAPIIENYSDDAESGTTAATDTQISFYGDKGYWNFQKNGWTIYIANGVSSASRTDLTPRQIKFKVRFLATVQFDAWEKEFTINITEAE